MVKNNYFTPWHTGSHFLRNLYGAISPPKEQQFTPKLFIMSKNNPNQQVNAQDEVKDVLGSLICKVESRFCAFNRAMAETAVLFKDKTPLSSNCSGTPEQYFEPHPPGMKRLNFSRCLQVQNPTKVNAPDSNPAPAQRRNISEFRNLPQRKDGCDKLETLFENGYDSDGEQAPYQLLMSDYLEELENACDIRAGCEPPNNNTQTGSDDIAEQEETNDNFVLIPESALKN